MKEEIIRLLEQAKESGMTIGDVLVKARGMGQSATSIEAIGNQFRKKPVVIEAVQIDKRMDQTSPVWWAEAIQQNRVILRGMGKFTRDLPMVEIETLEGTMTGVQGDWIIRGVQGELYPCKPDIFAATYEPAGPPAIAEPVEKDWKAIDTAIDEYLDGYELRGEPGDHTPTEFERFLLLDAINGLLAEEEFLALLASPPAAERAPVGDERAAFEKALRRRVPNAVLRRVDMAGSARLGEYCREEIETCWRLWQARAALAISPVGESVEWAGYRPLLRDAIAAKDAMHKAGIQYDKFGVMFPEMMRRYTAALDSAPVAGEAQSSVRSLQRYGFGYADDGNGGRYLSSLKRDDGAFLLRDDVIAALASGPAAQPPQDSDVEIVSMGGTAPAVPRWLLDAAQRIQTYMDAHSPGAWAVGGIQKRQAPAAIDAAIAIQQGEGGGV